MARRVDQIFQKLQSAEKNKEKEIEDVSFKMTENRPNEILIVQAEVHVPSLQEETSPPTTRPTAFENVPKGIADNCGSSNVNSFVAPCKYNLSTSSSKFKYRPNLLPSINQDATTLYEISVDELNTPEVPNVINEEVSCDLFDSDNILIDLVDNYNLNDEPLIFIVNENGEMNQMKNISENNNNELELSDELGQGSNDFNEIRAVESNLYELELVDIGLDKTVNGNAISPEPINNSDLTEEDNRIEEQSHERNVHNEENQDDADLNSKRTRKKRHQVKDDEWEYKRAKILREKGEQYKGRKLIDGKSKFVINKKERKMKAVTCKCKQKTFSCSVLSEDDRKKQFTKFWSMTWQEKKIYVSGLTEIDLTGRARDRKKENASRRKFSYKFHLNINKKQVRVCKQTFLNTFDLKGWTVNNWLNKEETDENKNDNMDNDESVDEERMENTSREKQKKNSGPSRQELLMAKHNSLKEFLLSLPTVESHYCRKSSTKLYLEPVWASKSGIYDHYSTIWCKEKDIIPLSKCSFHKTFEDLNLAIFQPKKDQCDTCRAYSLKHISDEIYQSHILKKDEAQREKEKDKAEEDNVFTVDLQSLLLCPKSNASALYYRRKLAVHNYCIFNLRSKEGYCFLWNESEGKLTANEFSSIMCYFLEKQILSSSGPSKKFIIYSDGCTYQNRCSTLSNAILHLAVKHKVIIEQKFLEKGHTYMECDSMHSVIERHLRNKDINVPADYVTVCKNARKHPKPYNVEYLNHTFFKDFNKEIKYKSIRPGDKVGDPKVTDIRCLQYSPEGKISYKLSYQDNYKELLQPDTSMSTPQRKSNRKSSTTFKDSTKQAVIHVGDFNFPQLYKSRQKIPREKFNHLQELKLSVPQDFHSYYDSLPTE